MGLLLRRRGPPAPREGRAEGARRRVYEKRKTEVRERRFFPEKFKKRAPLVVKAIDDYLIVLAGQSSSFRNWQRYGDTWKRALKDRTTLADVTPGDVQRRANTLRAEGLAPASVNRDLTFMRSAFNWAIYEERFDGPNPVKSKFFTREDNEHVRFLTDDEETRLASVLGDDEWPRSPSPSSQAFGKAISFAYPGLT